MSKRNLPEWFEDLSDDLVPETRSHSNSAGSSAKRATYKMKTNRVKNVPAPSQSSEVDQQLAVLAGQERGNQEFPFSYQASRHERGWLLSSLGGFYEHHWFEDVLRMVKGGKEASVYLCRTGTDAPFNAQPAAQERLPGPEQPVKDHLLAAKVYRPRMFRNLRNDALYREGRTVLDEDGHEIFDGRMKRAMRHKTSYGLELMHTAWLEHEFTTLQTLYEAGADVPKPFTSNHNAILMSYVGDEDLAAPTLFSIRLRRAEVKPLFERVLRNIEIMLAHERIHGDLSAFNILYWEGKITLIDFPQSIAPEQNRSAFHIFERDVTRICEYFTRQGLRNLPDGGPHRLAADLWTAYNHRLSPDVHPAMLDADDESDLAYWKMLQDQPDTSSFGS